MPFVVGENVGSYRILEQLGRGGMATVYKAYHAKLDRYVAIKALHPAFMEDPNFLARFQREARVVAKLEHPNIVPIYDFAEHERRPYLVMKFIQGETLKAFLSHDQISTDQTVKIVNAVGEALTYAHGQGVLHRDVKPSNVLLADDGRIYLADFGLARMAEAGESTLSADMMLGTPQYISPEQAMGMSDLDAGTDIYSFGVMLYELTVGQVPFSADTPFSIIHDHIYSPLPLPTEIKGDMPAALERVLLKALAKERDDRYDEVADLVTAFEAALLGADSDAAAPAAPTRAVPSGEPDSAVGGLDTAAPSRPLPADETESGPAPAEPKSSKRWRWWHLALAGFGVLMLFLFCAATANLIQNRVTTIQNKQAATQTSQVLLEQPTETIDKTSENFIKQTRQAVNQNPDDPFAHMALAFAYYDAGQNQSGNEEIKKAYGLGADAPDVYLKAASAFVEREMWLDSAKAYLQVAQASPEALSDDHLDTFHQSVYLMATQPQAADLFPDLAEVDPAMERVAKARNAYYQGDTDVEEMLADAMQIKTDFPEAILLKAEIRADQGEGVAARILAHDLKSRADTPAWIQEQLETLFPDIGQVSGIMDELRAEVEANPEDAELRLRLVDALLETEQYDQAEVQIERLLELAGDDPFIYYQLGEMLEKREFWLYAARAYQVGVQVSGQPSSPKMKEKIPGLVYLGSANPEAINVFDKMEAELDSLLLEIGRIRYALHHQDKGVAQEKLAQLKQQYPDSPEVLLLEAEILYNLGEEDAAIQQWNALLDDDQTPTWVRDQAQTFLDTFQP